MLKLYQFDRTWGIPNLSPFCCKVETYLRFAGIDYEIETALPTTAPKGKLPYIVDRDITLADSRFIVNHLKSCYRDLDTGLTDTESAIAVAMQRLIEEHLFWIALYSRWQYTDKNWQLNKTAIFSALPPIVRDLGARLTRRRIQQQIYGQGTGRHQPDEIFALGKQDIDALAGFLGDKKYFFGTRPTTLDASAFGLLINIIGCPIESPLKQHGLSKSNLHNYVARIMAEYYEDIQPRNETEVKYDDFRTASSANDERFSR